jgi:putative phosphoesterase
MKIAVISDTHAQKLDDLPAALLGTLMKADMIIHLGDFDTLEMVEELKGLNTFRGVTGNHDFEDIQAVLPSKDIVNIDGKTFGLIHGHGCFWPLGMIWPFGLRRGLISQFEKEKPDAILYGHTHVAINKVVNGTLFFNPGSVSGRFPASYRSFGVLHVDGKIDAEIVPIMQKDNFYISWPAINGKKQLLKRKVSYNTIPTQ